MPVILLSSSTAPMADYDTLLGTVAAWLHRSDLDAYIPTCVFLAEERMNRELRVRQMEVSLSATAIEDGRVSVPADTVGVKTLWIEGYESAPLKSQSFEFVKARGTDGIPAHWAWQGDYFYLDGAGTVAGVLYERIAALNSGNASNWVLTSFPSLYLYGALAEAWRFVKDEAEAQVWDARFRQVLAEVSGNHQRDTLSGPLVARAR